MEMRKPTNRSTKYEEFITELDGRIKKLTISRESIRQKKVLILMKKW